MSLAVTRAILRVSKDGTVERVSRVVSEDVGEDALEWSFPEG